MVQILPKDDPFTENSTHYGQFLPGWYARLVPWTSTFTLGSYSITCGIGNLFSGYFGAGQSVPLSTPIPSRVATFAKTLGSYGTQEMCWAAARGYYAADCTVRGCFSLFTHAGSPGVASFKGAGVGARISGGSYNDTALSERISNSSGYYFLLVNDALGAAEFLLMRVTAGTPTVLASSPADVAMPGWHLPQSMQLQRILELTVSTNGSGNPVLTCQVGNVDPFASDDDPAALIQPFAPYEDTSGSKITAAGRAAFGAYSDLDLGGGLRVATAMSFFEIVDTTSGDTVHRDEWERSNAAIGRAATDNNGKVGNWLACGFRGDIWGMPVGGTARELARDAGNNRVSSTAATMDRLSTRPATSVYECHRSMVFNVAYVSGTVEFGLAGRGSFLSALSGAFVSGWKFAVSYNGPWTARLTYYNASGVAVPWCTLTIATPATYSLNIAADNTLELQVKNIGPHAPEDGSTQIIAKINGVTVTGWVVAGAVLSSTQVQASGEVITNSGSVAKSGHVEGFVCLVAAGSVRADTWTDLFVGATPSIPEEDQESIVMTSECTGKTGTLSCPNDWPVSLQRQAYSHVHPYDSGHRNRIARALRQRRRWSIRSRACTPAQRAALLAFFDSHNGAQIPFTWVTPDSESVSARFRGDTLRYALLAPQVESFEIELEEVFC